MGKRPDTIQSFNLESEGLDIRVRGLVQGVGFRPAVWRMARDCGLAGHVLNDGSGVAIHIWGDKSRIEDFLHRLETDTPPLARIDSVESTCLITSPPDAHFHILHSQKGHIQTGVAPDAAICPDCLRDIKAAGNRRYRYPFTNCTHCGPRLSIIHTIPYDRANTAMSKFAMCADCQLEYDDPADRRFHAQPNACPECGPKVWLEDKTGEIINPEEREDTIKAVCRLILQGYIVAIKGIGGFHLACDATNEDTVGRLRSVKFRYDKPFALMACDAQMVSDYAQLDKTSRLYLEDRSAPIVILRCKNDALPLAASVAPGQDTLGFMLAYTPLHHILMDALERPVVMTSGNRSEEPQCITNSQAREHLASIADYWLMHDRDIVNRLDDSVVRINHKRAHILRRARGFAPAPVKLPEGFEHAPQVLAMGGELKNTFCLIRQGQAILSAHIGDLEDVATHREYRNSLSLYKKLFAFDPSFISVDMHPEYHSTQLGAIIADADNLPLDKVQHHHAHIAACMAEHNIAIDTEPVLGIALDGLGFGNDGRLWGGEFISADYRGFERLAHFAPVRLPGGSRAMREPWRNSYAHLKTALGWNEVCRQYPDLPIVRYLNSKPLQSLNIMLERELNSPEASSAGRLFDAVAAVIGICRNEVSYEGQAAMELEVIAASCGIKQAGQYDVDIDETVPVVLNWRLMWRGILADLQQGLEPALVAARFHNTLADTISRTAILCAKNHKLKTVALSGGVFQNRLLLEAVSRHLRGQGFEVLSHSQTPSNDGGISLGQAVVTAARALQGNINQRSLV